MIRKNRPRSSSLFLMELILAILFFSVASAVCVQIFVKAHLLSRRAEAKRHAVTECTNAAETFKVSPADTSGTSFTYFDRNFDLCEKKESAYCMKTVVTEENNMVRAQISMWEMKGEQKETPLYQLNTGRHLPERTAYEN